jgi:hypothetical protein
LQRPVAQQMVEQEGDSVAELARTKVYVSHDEWDAELRMLQPSRLRFVPYS